MEAVVGYNAWCALEDWAENVASFVFFPDEPVEPLIEFLQEHNLEGVDALVQTILAEGRLGRHVRLCVNPSTQTCTLYSMQ